MDEQIRDLFDRIIQFEPQGMHRMEEYASVVPPLRAQIVQAGGQAVPTLIEMLALPDPNARAEAATLLAQIGDKSAAEAVRSRLAIEQTLPGAALDREVQQVVASLKKALVACGGNSELASFVQQALTGDRAVMIESLNAIKQAGERGLPQLIAIVRGDGGDAVRGEAMLRLAYDKTWISRPEVVQLAMACVRDRAASVRQHVGVILVADDLRAASELGVLLKDESADVARSTAIALRGYALPEALLPALVALLDAEDAQTVLAALEVLLGHAQRGGILPTGLIDPLARCASPDRFPTQTKIKALTASLIGLTGDPGGVAALIQIMTFKGNRGEPKDSSHPAAQAIKALQTLGAQKATAGLLPMLADDDDAIRHNTAVMLGVLGASDAVEALESAAASDPNGGVKAMARNALARIRKAAPAGAPPPRPTPVSSHSAEVLETMLEKLEMRLANSEISEAAYQRLADKWQRQLRELRGE